MKKTNVFAAFNHGTFAATLIGFMALINLYFFIQGAFFTDGGYVFDVKKHIFDQLPVAFLCSISAAFVHKRGKK